MAYRVDSPFTILTVGAFSRWLERESCVARLGRCRSFALSSLSHWYRSFEWSVGLRLGVRTPPRRPVNQCPQTKLNRLDENGGTAAVAPARGRPSPASVRAPFDQLSRRGDYNHNEVNIRVSND